MRFPKIALFFLCFLANSHRSIRTAEPDLRPVFLRKGLTAGDWSSIRNEYERNRHAAVKETGGFRARNYTQQWTTHFDGHGFTVSPDSGSWSWGLKLQRFGFPGQERPVAGQAHLTSEKEKVRYGWGEIEEWYVNDHRGLEHGFTLAHRPKGAAGRLSMDFEVRGDLATQVAEDGRGVGFRDASGQVIVTYAGLKAWDADGKILAARFEQDADSNGLRLAVEESGARYPLTIDPIAQQAYLKASNTNGGDNFGFSVAVSGDTAVVGAFLEDSNATGVNGDQSNNTSPASGAVYVFVRNTGVWTQQAYLKASNTGAGDQFGFSVAISGDTLVVGAYLEDSNATGVDGDGNNDTTFNSGAAYVFVRSGAVWSQQAYLKASNTETNDGFGSAVSIAGDTVVVGSPFEDSNATGVNGNPNDNSTPDSGAVYVFVRSGTVWSQQAYVKASNPGGTDRFGSAVAISGDTVVVGAPLEDSSATGIGGNAADNNATDAGAAYIFVRSGVTWSQQAYVKASNTDTGDQFGYSVSISGDTAVVGARREDSAASGINGDASNNDATDSGAVYVFVRSGAAWSQQAYLKASNPENGDQFGYAVAISGDTLIVGAPTEDSSATGNNGDQSNNDAADSGAVYLFSRSGAVWTQQRYLKASNTDTGDNFGAAVGLSVDTIVVGAPAEDSSATTVNGDGSNNSAAGAGAAYAFLQSPGLNVSKSHIGNFTETQNAAAYYVKVTNSADAGPSAGLVTLAETLPSGLTLVSMTGTGWSCIAANCTRNDSLATGRSYPRITVKANVTSAVTPQVNSVTLSGGGSSGDNTTDPTNILAPFTDTASTDFFFDGVNLLRQYAITAGCSAVPPMYCPNDNVTRTQMAIFMVRAAMGGDTFTYSATPHFNDVPADAFGFKWIQKMLELGITAGCGNGNYCPNDPVTRGQMAIFVIRTRLGAAADSTFTYPGTPYFTDVPISHPFFKWIQRMKLDAITAGCGTGTTYCPDDTVTRGQMAIFIMRGAFNQILPNGTALIDEMSPVTGNAGSTVNVTLAGSNTHFATGTSVVNAGPGITVNSVVAIDGTTLTAQFVIDPAATSGPRSIVVTTGAEQAVLPNGFRIP
jgi:hypothetical protein